MDRLCSECGAPLPDSTDKCPMCGAVACRDDVSLAEAKYSIGELPTVSCPPCNAPEPTVPYNTQYSSAPHTYAAKPAAYVQSPKPAGGEALGLGQAVGMLLLNCIPLFGMIFMFIYAFGANARTKPSHANLAKAMLIMRLVGIAIGIALYIVILVFIFILAGSIPAFIG